MAFIDGDVAAPPYPPWVQTDEVLASIAQLLARMHAAASGFDDSGLTWSSELVDPKGGRVVCHNDVCIENVVFRNDTAVGLIDFDYAAPGRAIYDIAQFAKMCVPLDDPSRIARLGWDAPDQVGRLNVIADAYGLSACERVSLIEAIDDAMTVGAEFVARHFAAGEPGFVSMVEGSGGLQRWEHQRQWWREHAPSFEAALQHRSKRTSS